MVENVSRKLVLASVLSVLLNGNLNAGSSRHIYQSLPARSASAAKWSINVLKEKVSVRNLNQIESGFDLDEQEIKKFKLWPYGIISYYIDDLSYDKVLRDRIRNFLDTTSSLTGLHFLELPSPPKEEITRWVFFINRLGLLGCADHTTLNFTNEGVQKVTLGYNCMSEGGELAEAVLAIVGVPPQHNSPDRDRYIMVNMENIIPEKRYLFQMLKDNEWLFHDLEYDFSSAGHFNFHKHTKDGLPTLRPKRTNDLAVGENNGFSYGDILKIHMLYNYISKKKSNSIKAPDCNKLFEPGNNFKKFKPGYKDEIAPRPKPNKYLGLPDDDNIKNILYNKVNNGKYNKSEDENKSSVQSEENNNDDVVNKDNDDERDTTSYSKPEDGNFRARTIKAAMKKIDPLSLLSDYDTDGVRQEVKGKGKRGTNRGK